MYAKRALVSNMAFAILLILLPGLFEWVGGTALQQKLYDLPFVKNPFFFAGSLLFFLSLNVWAYMKKDSKRH